MSSPCLCTPGSLQLSLELLAKPQGQKVSAGAGGALPPQLLLHSQVVGTGRMRRAAMGGSRAVTEEQNSNSGSQEEQSKTGCWGPGGKKAVGCQR